MTGAARPFTHVVPLGLSCRVTYQLRLYARSGTTLPFDWWMSPLDGLARYLESPDPDRIFAEGALTEQRAGDHIESIVSREFGFQLFHDFPRVEVGGPMRMVAPDWRRHVPEVRAQHVRRLDRLRALDRAGHRLLFVRHKVEKDVDTRQASAGVDRLWRALEAGWPRAEVWLLLVNVAGVMPPSPRVAAATIADSPGPGAEAWRGDEAEWAGAFRTIGLGPLPGPTEVAPPTPAERD